MLVFRQFAIKLTAIAALVSSFSILPATAVAAETCPTYDFNALFVEDYYPGTAWAKGGSKKEITWSLNLTTIQTADNNLVPVSRPFSTDEAGWVQLAIDSWDSALDSITFRQVNNSTAELTIGYATFGTSGREGISTGIWEGWWGADNIRYKATIRIRDSANFLQTKTGFIHAIQHEVGNVLGLGDISPSSSLASVQEDPWQAPYGPLPLSDFDIGMIRQLYGESTCPSSWKNSTQLPTQSLTELIAQVAELQKSINLASDEISQLKNQVNEISALNTNLRQKNKALQAKIKRICAVKPKPKNC